LLWWFKTTVLIFRTRVNKYGSNQEQDRWRMGDMRNSYKVLVGKPKGKRLFARLGIFFLVLWQWDQIPWYLGCKWAHSTRLCEMREWNICSITDKAKPKCWGEKPAQCHLPFYPPQTLHELPQDRTQAYQVRSQPLTAWAMNDLDLSIHGMIN
jgi:hypothetical protein